MYLFIKNTITKIVPRKFLFEHEEKIRKVYSIAYSGRNFSCSVCSKKLSKFIIAGNSDSICPACGSLKRNRRLWMLLEQEFLFPNCTLLDFSPSRSLFRKLKKRTDINYTSTDLSGDFIADYQWDITQIPSDDNVFDLIICYHILEHIKEDTRAMKELFRVLKPGGNVLVQTPFKEGDIYENEMIVSDEDRLIHFGQEDHVRVYSVTGLKKRLELSGFEVAIRHYLNEKNQYDLASDEIILVLTKPIN